MNGNFVRAFEANLKSICLKMLGGKTEYFSVIEFPAGTMGTFPKDSPTDFTAHGSLGPVQK
jgi:hypothetical protein